MKTEEAGAVLAMLTSGFHRESLEQGTIDLWIEVLEPMDAGVATQVALSWVKTEDRFPSISQFRHAYHGERKRSEPELSAAIAPVDGFGLPTNNQPQWVKEWQAARAKGDMRVFEEQVVGETKYRDDPRYTREEAEAIGLMPPGERG